MIDSLSVKAWILKPIRKVAFKFSGGLLYLRGLLREMGVADVAGINNRSVEGPIRIR